VRKDQISSPINYLYLASVPCQLGSFRLIGGGRAHRPFGTRREGNGEEKRGQEKLDEIRREERKEMRRDEEN
jgi:hypothetical protein